MNRILLGLVMFTCLMGKMTSAFANENLSTEEIAKKLNNPVAAMISVPIQINYDQNIGSDDKTTRYIANIQPVVPFELNKDWNVISRTILPVVKLDTETKNFSGTGDIIQSVFFSPKAPTDSGWIWGAGPVFLLPTASNDAFASDKFGIGPTAVVLKQDNGWTYGALANHIWSVAGKSEAQDVNSSFIQPFVGYTWATGTSMFLNTEATIDWENDENAIPINLTTSKVTRIAGETFSLSAGLRYWAKSTDNGPEGLGFRLAFTWLIPR